jgi:hypothetical protein
MTPVKTHLQCVKGITKQGAQPEHIMGITQEDWEKLAKTFLH